MARREKKLLAKQVVIAIGGGLLEIVTELVGDNALPQADIITGVQPYNVGDALGLLEATLVTAFGIAKEKPQVVLVGAGGLAVAFPNLLGKAIINSMTPTVGTQALRMNGGSSTGKYGRNVALTPMKVIAWTSRQR